MSSNDIVILEGIIADKRQETAPEMSKEDFFELFCSEQATKEFSLSYEELEYGIVDGEHDGGIDSIYTFVNGELIGEDFESSNYKKSVSIDLVVVQSKSSAGFNEGQINKLISSSKHLLSLSQNYTSLMQYNDLVKSRCDIFRGAYRKLASKFPDLRIKFVFAAKKADSAVHHNLDGKAQELVGVVNDLFADATVKFEFWGARRLLELSRQRPDQAFELEFERSLNGSGGYIALVALPKFYKFLCGGGDGIRKDLFESNVRDYQGTTEVNIDIGNTLQGDRSNDFWWFNNGVTVLASKASSSGSVITIQNPQIVNGLQTSSQVGEYCSTNGGDDTRMVMVKVVTSEDEEVRDKIIKATNNQNKVPLASLRSTDKVQRDIEHILKDHGIYYDRRKNYYKNEGRPSSKIISINLLAQAAMTLFRWEPDNARARPSTLIKNDTLYGTIFSETVPMAAYVVAADTIKRVELALKRRGDLSARDRNNLRFYVLLWVVAYSAQSVFLSPAKVSQLQGKISDGEIEVSIDKVNALFQQRGASDQLSKGTEFREYIRSELEREMAEPQKTEA